MLFATAQSTLGLNLQVMQSCPDLRDPLAEGNVLGKVDLADPDRGLVLAFIELVEQRVFDFELANVGGQIGNTECAVTALSDAFDAQLRAINADHGGLLGIKNAGSPAQKDIGVPVGGVKG